MPRLNRVIPLAHDRLLLGGQWLRPSSAGYAAHVVHRSGEIRSIVPTELSLDLDYDVSGYRNLTLCDDGLLWTIPLNSYLLHSYRLDGERVHELRRVVDWFEPGGQPRRSSESPPEPLIGFIHCSPEGHLWVLSWIPAEGWDELDLSAYESHVARNHDIYDSVLEVIDPDTGVVVARTRFDEFIRSPPTAGELQVLEQDALGDIRIRVLYVSLDRR